jgi:hypothetical protein
MGASPPPEGGGHTCRRVELQQGLTGHLCGYMQAAGAAAGLASGAKLAAGEVANAAKESVTQV